MIRRSYTVTKRDSSGHFITSPIALRFWSKVDKNGPVHPTLGTRCWLWIACKLRGGYGQIDVDELKTRAAHRVSFMLSRGAIPEGLHVLHHCDNPPCVNPGHLYAGTPQQNADDKGRRNRSARFPGEANQAAKLTAESVRSIRARAATYPKIAHRQLAAEYGISQSSISRLIAREAWKDV